MQKSTKSFCIYIIKSCQICYGFMKTTLYWTLHFSAFTKTQTHLTKINDAINVCYVVHTLLAERKPNKTNFIACSSWRGQKFQCALRAYFSSALFTRHPLWSSPQQKLVAVFFDRLPNWKIAMIWCFFTSFVNSQESGLFIMFIKYKRRRISIKRYILSMLHWRHLWRHSLVDGEYKFSLQASVPFELDLYQKNIYPGEKPYM